MSDDLWIVVPGWDKFQHYGDRTPIWIKLYLELRDKDEWRSLTFAQRGLLVSIWMEYCASKGTLGVSKLGQKCGQKVHRRTLDSLLSLGFIELSASKPLALARSREKRRVEKNARTRENKNKPEPRPAAAAYEPFPNGHPDRDVEAGLTAIHDILATTLKDSDRTPP